MASEKRKIVFATIFQNGGDATRALEIAKALRDGRRGNGALEITFISRGSRFEAAALREGFSIYRARPALGGVQYLDDFQTRFGELIGSVPLAQAILQGEMEAYEELKPDLLVHGFWPIGSIARRMVIPRTPTVAFLPLPLTEEFLQTVHRFPNEMALSRLPGKWQKALLSSVPLRWKERLPALRHRCIRRAAEALGWKGRPLDNIFRMLESDLYLVNDFPDFYPTASFDERTVFTGPLFSLPLSSAIGDAAILRVLSSENPKPKLFCTLGSSGSRAALLEVICMFNVPDCRWSGIVLCPPAICPLSEARALLKNPDVVLTDAFVPAAEINARVDAVVCHGGQGTLQTAVLSGTPLVGMPAQPEQQMNLQHLAEYGMAVVLPPRNWNARTIGAAVGRILRDPRFRERAAALQRRAASLDARKTIVDRIGGILAGL